MLKSNKKETIYNMVVFVISAKVTLILEYIVEKVPFKDDAEKYLARKIYHSGVIIISVLHI